MRTETQQNVIAAMIDATALHRQKLQAICRSFHVRRLDLFGSAARDDFDPEHSDFDFIVEFERDMPVHPFRPLFRAKGGVGGSIRPEDRFARTESGTQSLSKVQHRAQAQECLCGVTPGVISGMR
jgi:hypothetical protein